MENDNVKEEDFFAKERRLKARRRSYSATVNKGVFFENKQELIKWIEQKDILIRVEKGGNMDDGTDFITISIEGFKSD